MFRVTEKTARKAATVWQSPSPRGLPGHEQKMGKVTLQASQERGAGALSVCTGVLYAEHEGTDSNLGTFQGAD